ncbi:MAG: SUMF1/EgtB/PvdO family nonheme iron enzyme [Pontiella sp.]
MKRNPGLMLVAALIAVGAQADLFGSGDHEFELIFKNISSGSNSSGEHGQVDYDYGIGTYEITANQWVKYIAMSGGPAGGSKKGSTTIGNHAVDYVSWYEAAQFVNWLNTSSGGTMAYNFDDSGTMSLWGEGTRAATSAYRHKDAVYVLPSDDEWVKAAYWNGINLQIYATPLDTQPVAGVDANYAGSGVWEVGSGAEELNGTYDMMGNLWEWNESAFDGADDNVHGTHVIHGGAFEDAVAALSSSEGADKYNPGHENDVVGFRVAVIPEPASMVLISLFGGGMLLVRRIFMK